MTVIIAPMNDVEIDYLERLQRLVSYAAGHLQGDLNKEQIELYDLKTDWSEQKNLVSEKPEVAQKLSAKLDAWKASLPDKPSSTALSVHRAKKEKQEKSKK